MYVYSFVAWLLEALKNQVVYDQQFEIVRANYSWSYIKAYNAVRLSKTLFKLIEGYREKDIY